MGRLGRFIAGVFFAPFAVFPAVFVSMGLASLFGLDPIDSFDEYVGIAFLMSAFGIFYGWVILAVFGLPAYGILAWADLDYAVPSAVVGGVIGLLFGLLYGSFWGEWLWLVTMACGAAVAALFSRIVNGAWRLPDDV